LFILQLGLIVGFGVSLIGSIILANSLWRKSLRFFAVIVFLAGSTLGYLVFIHWIPAMINDVVDSVGERVREGIPVMLGMIP